MILQPPHRTAIQDKNQACRSTHTVRILPGNKTRQGYARKRILKPAGYFFVRGASWQQ